jgi:hypothetical protein
MIMYDFSRFTAVLLKAQAVHELLGDRYYSIYRIASFRLKNGLLIESSPDSQTPQALCKMGFQPGIDFGVGYVFDTTQFVRCEGIEYSFDEEELRSATPWSEAMLPAAVRGARHATVALLRDAYEALEVAALDVECDSARLEQIPEKVVAWARKQQTAMSELSFIRRSVSNLRSRNVSEAEIQAALNHPSFSQEIIRLNRSSGAG